MLHAGLKHQHAQLRVATRHSCGPAEGKRWRAAHASFMCDEMFTATILKIAADLVLLPGTYVVTLGKVTGTEFAFFVPTGGSQRE